jgi:nucleoside-diphosphate-sugar epimerase
VKVLVTGGRGFLGTHVCAALRDAGHGTAPPGRADGLHSTLDRQQEAA